MQHINVKQMGLAFGITGAMFYIGCVLLMATVGHNVMISLSNQLLHGLDVTSIMRAKVQLWEVACGLVETFVLSFLAGACISAIYNRIGARTTAS